MRLPFVSRPYQLYDSRKYFESKYKAGLEHEFSDRAVIAPDFDVRLARYHYNKVENAIIEHLTLHDCRRKPSVLDVGTGAGHWIDFFRDLFQARFCVGVELSKTCTAFLRKKYADLSDVRLINEDISATTFNLHRSFEIICAVGVFFHIVDDRCWKQAVTNLARHLDKDGLIIVGGSFGWLTRNAQFANADSFTSWEEYDEAVPERPLLKKRLRSLRKWRKCLGEAGLSLRSLHRQKHSMRIEMPENNLLFIKHKQ